MSEITAERNLNEFYRVGYELLDDLSRVRVSEDKKRKVMQAITDFATAAYQGFCFIREKNHDDAEKSILSAMGSMRVLSNYMHTTHPNADIWIANECKGVYLNLVKDHRFENMEPFAVKNDVLMDMMKAYAVIKYSHPHQQASSGFNA